MNATSTGLLAGLLLALAIILGGLTGFLLALVLGALGLLAGAWRDGVLDPGMLRRGSSRD